MNSKVLLIVAILTLASVDATLKAQLTLEDERFIVEYMAINDIPGISITIVKNGEITYSNGFGVGDYDSKDSITINTLFQAASISKSLTAVLYLRNYQKGVLSLDNSINNYLKSWKLKPYKKTVTPTVRQLLSHTGGTNVSGFLGYRCTRKKIPDLDMILRGNKYTHFFETPIKVKYKPNSVYRYSGGGYCVLQKAICEINDEDFPTQMRSEILDQCGMSSSFFAASLSKRQEQMICVGHKKNGKAIKDNYHVYPQLAAAGLWTTSDDLARFLIEIQRSIHSDSSEAFLSKESIREMLTMPVLDDGTISKYGLGFDLEVDPTGERVTSFSHSGANWGYSSFMWASTDTGQAYVIMCNRHLANLWPISRVIREKLSS